MQSRIDEEILRLKHLLNLEKRDDFLQYQSFIQNATLEQRRFKGVCWQPLKIIDSGYGLGDYPYMVVERTKFLDVPHQFSGGKTVSIYLVNGDSEYDSVQGTVQWAEKNSVKIILSADDFPGWVHNSSIGLNLLFDDKSYKEMEWALERMLDTSNKRARELMDKSLGNSDLHFNKTYPIPIPTLNESQENALNYVLSSCDISVVHGPPGTGKTTTLIETIAQLAKTERKILVCAPSNAATDLLAERCAARGLNTIRLGNLSRIDPEIMSLTVEEKISQHERAKEIKQVKRKAIELRSMASKYKRNFGHSEREQRKLMYQQAKMYAREANELEDYIIEDILNKSEVICCTLVGANHKYLEGMIFKTCVIDEAAQALEPACWIPILKSEKVVLSGDPFQLPPTVKSDEAKKNGLDITLIEKCITHHSEIALLTTQYRMNSQIMTFSNRQFYANALKAHASVADHLVEGLHTISNQPIEFIDTAGTGFMEQESSESRSLENKGEQDLVKKYLETLLTETEIDKNTTIGVISPYKAQVLALQEVIGEEIKATLDIDINTIDSFQGQERDIIIISMVRSNEDGTIGFLSDLRRMNVAMTRAKKKLVVIGDSGTLAQHPFYQSFMEFVDEIGAYKSAFEWMY